MFLVCLYREGTNKHAKYKVYVDILLQVYAFEQMEWGGVIRLLDVYAL